ncbi:MAG: M2 family metallopeptidase [Candidatus Omnitrophica bacterium]|nr:M2 family metallopeptidase [Candidatus Omnitrophota bacterium]
MIYKTLLFLLLGLITAANAQAQGNESDNRLQTFIKEHVEQIQPLQTSMNRAYWRAATTGNDDDYDHYNQLQLDIRKIYSDSKEFEYVKSMREKGDIHDPSLKRQLDKLYLSYLSNQTPPELLERIVALDTKIQKTYNIFRGEMEGEKVTNSDIYLLLTTETDLTKRELAWRASKQVGEEIIEDLLQLIKLRNQAARLLGFENFHTFSITIAEQTVDELDSLFDRLDRETREPFSQLKNELDRLLSEMYGISPDELMPWHYHDPFFQRTPLVYELNLDDYYKKFDVKILAETFYAGIGLPVDGILQRSDLYDREGKYPHAFSEDIDRMGDVRILCNLNNDERWMETILHELGHAIYSLHHDPDEPYLLREPAHSFTTEAIAMFFGRLSRNAAWMQGMLRLTDEERQEIENVSWRYTQFQQLLFTRWAMVMYHFEKQLYANPEQDLNSLWWSLVKNYQFVNPPPKPYDAGWASKLHFVSAPCYYHNYMLGELLASQLHHYLSSQIIKSKSDKTISYINQKEVGAFLKKQIFAPGAKYEWNDLIRRATGEPLTPAYFIQQFVKE